MIFINNRYIFENGKKEKLQLDFYGLTIENFLLNGKFGYSRDYFKEILRNKYKDAIFFDEVDYGEYVYIDDDVIIENKKETIHNFLLPSQKKMIIDDLKYFKKFISSYKKIVSVENLSEFCSDFMVIDKFLIMNLIKNIFIKVNGEFLDIFSLNGKFVKRVKNITIKINNSSKIIQTDFDGVGRFYFEDKGLYGKLKIGDKVLEINYEGML